MFDMTNVSRLGGRATGREDGDRDVGLAYRLHYAFDDRSRLATSFKRRKLMNAEAGAGLVGRAGVYADCKSECESLRDEHAGVSDR
jgi:hypothetical protein